MFCSVIKLFEAITKQSEGRQTDDHRAEADDSATIF